MDWSENSDTDSFADPAGQNSIIAPPYNRAHAGQGMELCEQNPQPNPPSDSFSQFPSTDISWQQPPSCVPLQNLYDCTDDTQSRFPQPMNLDYCGFIEPQQLYTTAETMSPLPPTPPYYQSLQPASPANGGNLVDPRLLHTAAAVSPFPSNTLEPPRVQLPRKQRTNNTRRL